MSKVAVLADPHLRGKDLLAKTNMLAEMMRICDSRDVKCILNAGDTFDQGEVGDKAAPAEKIISSFTNIVGSYPHITMIMLEGNHDQYGSEGRRGSALDFIHLPNIIKMKDTVSEYHFDDDFSVVGIPWIVNDKDYLSKIEAHLSKCKPINFGKCRILLGHLEVIGCALGHSVCTAEHYYSFGLGALENNAYSPHRVFLGHVHSKIQLTEKSMYMGAFSQLRFDEDEGKSAGFHIYDTVTDKLEFFDLSYLAPSYHTIMEHELPNYNIERDFVRFYTNSPEKYKHLRGHVRAMQSGLHRIESEDIYQQVTSNDLNIDHLIQRYCGLRGLTEPTSTFYAEEKAGLALNFSSGQTGLDFISDIHLHGVGIHKDKKVKFGKGFNCITGKNGVGKTTILESVLATLYENYPERGNIKGLMDKGSFIKLNLEAKGVKYAISKELANKRLVSHINDTIYELVGQYKTAIEPIFGDSNTFTKLVFADQNGRFDLVKTAESNRLAVFRDLFDLKHFDDKAAIYKEDLKKVKQSLSEYGVLKTELASLFEEFSDIEIKDAFTPTADIQKLKAELKKAIDNNEKYEANVLHIKQHEEMLAFEAAHDVAVLTLMYNRRGELYAKMAQYKSMDKVGCKDNPLPCIYLKNVLISQKEYEALNAEYQSLELPKDWNDYKYLKNRSLGAAYPKVEQLKLMPTEDLRRAIRDYELGKVAYEANQKLIAAKGAVKRRLDAKEAQLAGYNLAELEARALDLRFLLDLCGKSGLSLFIIDIIKTELQNVLNELIEFSELGIKVALSTNKKDDLDSFEILFGEAQYDICKASGGEIGLVRILFKLAIMVYLNRYFGSYKVLILDEPTAALDNDNTEAVIAIIKKLCAADFAQIIVVSHSNKMANSCDHRIEV